MRLLIQRVNSASVTVDGKVISQIDKGIVAFLGIHKDDHQENIHWLIDKMLALRIFEDNAGKMNLSLLDIQGQVLIVSQFTLYGDCSSGRRPDLFSAMKGNGAEMIYNQFVNETKQKYPNVQTGIFGAYMQVSLINDGPVTFMIEGK